jgi:hypothetical protein
VLEMEFHVAPHGLTEGIRVRLHPVIDPYEGALEGRTG